MSERVISVSAITGSDMLAARQRTVALIGAFFPPDFGGVPTTLGILIREYLRMRVCVIVAAPTAKPHDPDYHLATWIQTDAIRVARSALNSLIDDNQGSWQEVQMILQKTGAELAALLVPYQPDLINSHTEHRLGDIVSQRLAIPHIITLHGYPPDPEDFQLAGRPDNPRMEIPRGIVQNTLPTTTITTVSYFTRGRWIRAGISPAKMSVIYNPIRLDLFRPNLDTGQMMRAQIGVDPQTLLLLCPQRTRRFGMDTVVYAAHRLITRNVRPTLLFCDSELTPEIQMLVEKLGMTDMVITRSFCYEQMPHVYAASDIVILPDTLEHFGIPCIEAMAVGRPIIACRSGSYNELLRHEETALLVPPRDLNALTNALERIIVDDALRIRLSSVPASELARYTPATAAAQYLATYERAIVTYDGRGKAIPSVRAGV